MQAWFPAYRTPMPLLGSGGWYLLPHADDIGKWAPHLPSVPSGFHLAAPGLVSGLAPP